MPLAGAVDEDSSLTATDCCAVNWVGDDIVGVIPLALSTGGRLLTAAIAVSTYDGASG